MVTVVRAGAQAEYGGWRVCASPSGADTMPLGNTAWGEESSRPTTAWPSPPVVRVGTEDVIFVLLLLKLERQPPQVSLLQARTRATARSHIAPRGPARQLV